MSLHSHVLLSHPTSATLIDTFLRSFRTYLAFSAFFATFRFSLSLVPSRRPAAPAMSRKPDPNELLARAKAKGYQKGAHKEKDQVRNRHKHVNKTKKDHDATLNRYVL
jgi:hypothetical protein